MDKYQRMIAVKRDVAVAVAEPPTINPLQSAVELIRDWASNTQFDAVASTFGVEAYRLRINDVEEEPEPKASTGRE